MNREGFSSLPRPGAISRRRAIALLGLALGGTALPRLLQAAAPQRLRWSGTALGAAASLDLYHEDAEAGRALITEAITELHRLERIFSLADPSSALSRLNRDGRLEDPPAELVRLLQMADSFSLASGGAFDVTVQPLWTLYSSHFAQPGASADGPPAEAVAAARALVGWQGVSIAADRIAFARPGMGITLNGIAQGFITDRVTALLRARGVTRVLADLGEMRALGRHPDGRPWHVGIADPHHPESLLKMLELEDQAVASSGGYGTVFEPSGRFHHLFVPATGRCADSWAGTTVRAADATTADALSTALAVAPPERAAAILAAGGGQSAWLVDSRGRIREIGQGQV